MGEVRPDHRRIATPDAVAYLGRVEAGYSPRRRFAVRAVRRRRSERMCWWGQCSSLNAAVELATSIGDWVIWRERGDIYAEW